MQSVQIIPNIDPLKSDSLPNLGMGKFQTPLLQQPLDSPTNANDFYSFKTMNSYELGVDANWLIKYLERRNEEIENVKYINGNAVIIESIEAGERCYNYEKLILNGNNKFGFFYKLARGLLEKDSAFSIMLFSHNNILQLLKNEMLMVKHTGSQQLLKEVSYCLYKELTGSLCGSEHFRIYAGEVIIYDKITKFY